MKSATKNILYLFCKKGQVKIAKGWTWNNFLLCYIFVVDSKLYKIVSYYFAPATKIVRNKVIIKKINLINTVAFLNESVLLNETVQQMIQLDRFHE